jgi:lysine-N-methylase
MTSILRSHLLSRFSCLGDACEDTCCQGWSMQVDEPTLARYKSSAPELLDAVEPARETPWIMRKDKSSGLCIKLEGGMCGIHKKFGDVYLSDACHFYPRATRALGGNIIMTATMSCPEIARLALSESDACALLPAEVERLPHHLKDYTPPEITPDAALAIHRAFLSAAEDNASSAEKIFLRIASASRSLALVAKKDWPQAVPFYLKSAEAFPVAAEPHQADPFNLLHALAGLVVASQKPPSARLRETIGEMEKALAVTLDWQQVLIHTSGDSLPGWLRMKALWEQEGAVRFAPTLRRWLQMQMSLALYPFAGLGETLEERITIIGVRLATVRLALMSACSLYGTTMPQETALRILQSLSRFLDHLGDPAFSLAIYTETGWIRDARMRGLLG